MSNTLGVTGVTTLSNILTVGTAPNTAMISNASVYANSINATSGNISNALFLGSDVPASARLTLFNNVGGSFWNTISFTLEPTNNNIGYLNCDYLSIRKADGGSGATVVINGPATATKFTATSGGFESTGAGANAILTDGSFVSKLTETAAGILIMKNPSALNRWVIGYTNTNADFGIFRYNNSGGQIDTPISIDRTTGVVTITNVAKTYVYTGGSSSLTVPTGYTTATIEATGGGGSGGNAGNSSGSGGGGSGFLRKATVGVSAGLVINITVGAGASPPATIYTTGNDGGNSVVAVSGITTLTAIGGKGGGNFGPGGYGGVTGVAGILYNPGIGLGGAGGFGTVGSDAPPGFSGVGGGGAGGAVDNNGGTASSAMYGAGGGGSGTNTGAGVLRGGSGIGGCVRIILSG